MMEFFHLRIETKWKHGNGAEGFPAVLTRWRGRIENDINKSINICIYCNIFINVVDVVDVVESGEGGGGGERGGGGRGRILVRDAGAIIDWANGGRMLASWFWSWLLPAGSRRRRRRGRDSCASGSAR